MTADVWLVSASGRRVAASLARSIASAGSQGEVWEVAGFPNVVAKVMHRRDAALAERVRAMLASPPGWAVREGAAAVAWPLGAVLRRTDGRLIGYTAPKLELPRFAHLPLLFNPGLRARLLPAVTWQWHLQLAEDLSRTMAAVHRRGHVIGDLAPANMFVSPDARVCLIDADGWQIARPDDDALLCPFSRPEYTAPEGLYRSAHRRSVHSDWWALAVVVMQLVYLGLHPFGGVPTGGVATAGVEPVEEVDNVRARRSWLMDIAVSPPRGFAPRGLLPPNLFALFARTVGEGHTEPARRPSPDEWARELHLTQQQLTRCATFDRHAYPLSLARCPWCAMVADGSADPFGPAFGTAGSHDRGQ